MKEVRKVKQLNTQLKNLVAEAEDLKVRVAEGQREYDKKRLSIEKLKSEIAKIEGSSKLKVSEHAIVRYFERVKGYDISEVEKEILSEQVVDLVEKLGGNGKYPNGSFSVVMRNHTVLTVVN